jgi:hypothetical protein
MVEALGVAIALNAGAALVSPASWMPSAGSISRMGNECDNMRVGD